MEVTVYLHILGLLIGILATIKITAMVVKAKVGNYIVSEHTKYLTQCKMHEVFDDLIHNMNKEQETEVREAINSYKGAK